MSQVQWKDNVPVFSNKPPPTVQKMLEKLKEKRLSNDSSSDELSNDETSNNDSLKKNDEAGSCTYCQKRFDSYSKFLRHVSHSKLCLEAHNPDVIERIKRKSNLRNKRKWYKKNKEKVKELKQKVKESKQMKSNNEESKDTADTYITVGEKKSFHGKCFYNIFEMIYDEQVQKARERMEVLTERRTLSEGLKMELMDDALDFAFGCAEDAFNDMPIYFCEERILNQAFLRLEVKFQDKYKEECSDQKETWKENQMYDVTDDLFHSALSRAYRNFFRKVKFRDTMKNAEDRALDRLFFEEIDSEKFTFDEDRPFEFESALADRFKVLWAEDSKTTFKDSGLQHDFEALMEKILKQRFYDKELKFKD